MASIPVLGYTTLHLMKQCCYNNIAMSAHYSKRQTVVFFDLIRYTRLCYIVIVILQFLVICEVLDLMLFW